MKTQVAEWWDKFWHADCSPSELEEALKNGVDPNAIDPDTGDTPLFHVVKDVRLMSVLLKAGANPNVANHNGETPLTHCATLGREDETDCLLDHGADPNLVADAEHRAGEPGCECKWPALFCAAHWGHLPVVKRLLDAGANPSYVVDGCSAFYFACSHGHLLVAEELLRVSSPEALACAQQCAEQLLERVELLVNAVKAATPAPTGVVVTRD